MKLNMFTLARTFDTLDHKAIAEWVAMNEPEVFVAAAGSLPGRGSLGYEWATSLSEVYRPADRSPRHGPAYVAAIKFVRERTGLGLYEAKRVIDQLRGREDDTPMPSVSSQVLAGIASWGITRLV